MTNKLFRCSTSSSVGLYLFKQTPLCYYVPPEHSQGLSNLYGRLTIAGNNRIVLDMRKDEVKMVRSMRFGVVEM